MKISPQCGKAGVGGGEGGAREPPRDGTLAWQAMTEASSCKRIALKG